LRVFVALGLLAGTVVPPVAARAAGPDADFFVERFGDALDYTNAEDVPIARDLTIRAARAAIDGGALRIDLAGAGWISLLWPGVPGGIPVGREGVINPIDASKFGRLGLAMRVSSAQPVIALWHTCAAANAGCQGGTVFSASPEQTTYSIDLSPVTTDPGLSAPWAGSIVGLRLLFPVGAGSVELDWVRLSPKGAAPLGERTDRAATTSPNNAFDYATLAGNAWDFDDADAVTSGVASSSITGGVLSACNAPTKASTGDAAFTLRLPSGFIDADRFHRLVVALRQDGPLSLEFGPGGGMNMRVVWRDAANRRHVSKDIVMYNNEATVSFDLRNTGIGPLGVDGTAWRGRVTEFRIDPNEDSAGRCWRVDHVWLLADDGVDFGPKPQVAANVAAAPKQSTAKATKPAVKTKKRAPTKTTVRRAATKTTAKR
jgi:hypothetical protein